MADYRLVHCSPDGETLLHRVMLEHRTRTTDDPDEVTCAYCRIRMRREVRDA